MNFKSAYAIAPLGMCLAWLFYGYKNYDYFFIDNKLMDYTHMWENVTGVAVFAVLSFVMCRASRVILSIVIRAKEIVDRENLKQT